MAYTKKKWVDVPDPSNLPDVPEGQSALARFDAENMNRIEEGISDSTNHVADATKHITQAEKTAWNNKANANADGEAYSAWRLPFVRIDSSSNLHKGHWIKFATLNCTSGIWVFSGVKLSFQDTESGTLSGILNVYVRTLGNIDTQDIKLTWDTINNINYASCVAAVKEGSGLFGLYFQPPSDYCSINITLLTTTHSRISLLNKNGDLLNKWVSEITPLKLSGYTPLYSYSQTDLVAGDSPLETGKLYFVYE